MHDGPEGVTNYVMSVLSFYLIYVGEFFIFETLNTRIQHFDYGYIELGNKPLVN